MDPNALDAVYYLGGTPLGLTAQLVDMGLQGAFAVCESLFDLSVRLNCLTCRPWRSFLSFNAFL